MIIIWLTVCCRKLNDELTDDEQTNDEQTNDEQTNDEQTENNEEHDIPGHNNLGLKPKKGILKRNPQSLV